MFTVLEIVLVGGNTIGSQNTHTDANEITNKLRLFHFTITIYPLCKKLSPCSHASTAEGGVVWSVRWEKLDGTELTSTNYSSS